MPIVHAVVRCPVRESFRVCQVQGMFDLPPGLQSREEFTVDVPSVIEPWSIGVIVGPSGSGKSTIARQAFGENLVSSRPWPKNRSVLDGFPARCGIREITQLLGSVGFSSPPAWLRPFAALSTGEQFRVNLARALAEFPELAVIDEFTSVVDRTVAQIGSAAVARAVRRSGRRLVAVTCHYDVLPWLEPDWVLDIADQRLMRYHPGNPKNARRLLRPSIQLRVVRCHRSAWKLFQRHHYLTADLHPSAGCFVGLVENRPAVFASALQFPHATAPGWREHRCVCLPDFQGLGIGSAMSAFVASLYAATGRPYLSVTSHPAMIHHRMRSSLWKMIRPLSRVRPRRRPSMAPNIDPTQLDKTVSWRRMTATFRYTGPAKTELARSYQILPPAA